MWTASTCSVTLDVATVNTEPGRRILGVVTTAYHHGNLREALVDEGFELARAHGADGVVLREVARRVGVSHNAAYRHFADRSELLGEIAARAMAMLVQAMHDRLARTPGDLADVDRARWRLEAIGRAYVEFALAEPGIFRVAFSEQAAHAHLTTGGEPEAAYELAGPFLILNESLDDLVDVGYLDPLRRPGAEMACWSGVHGFALLVLDGPLRATPPEVRSFALDYLLSALDVSLGVPAEAPLA